MIDKTQPDRQRRYRAKLKETVSAVPELKARVAALEAENGQLRDKLEATKRIGDLAKSLQAENKRLKAGEAATDKNQRNFEMRAEIKRLKEENADLRRRVQKTNSAPADAFREAEIEAMLGELDGLKDK